MLILCKIYQREPRRISESRQDHIGRVLGDLSSSFLASSGSEIACFFLGTVCGTPAVRNFALVAGTAVTINFILQMTCFIALLSLDDKRQEV